MESPIHPYAPDYDEHSTDAYDEWADAQEAEREELAALYDADAGSPLTYPEYDEMTAPF